MTGNPAASRWFYAHGGRRHGPVEIARLVDLILAGEVPETTLIWHPGLPEWIPAREVDEVRRELPPPLPLGAPSTPGLGLAETTPADPVAAGGESPEGRGLRRRRRHRHHASRNKYPWLLPLLVVLLFLMIGLWWLLRRMNEVPDGRIILQGALAPDGRKHEGSPSWRTAEAASPFPPISRFRARTPTG